MDEDVHGSLPTNRSTKGSRRPLSAVSDHRF